MNDRPGADRVKRLRIVFRYAAASLWRRLAWLFWRIVLVEARAPVRVLIAPPDLRTADPTVAADIYSGYFLFDGKFVNTHGRSPFLIAPPSEGWAETLADFGWLRHLRAADTALARINARALVGDWIDQVGRGRERPAWSPDVVSRRLLSWLSQSPIILDGADGAFYRLFMVSLARHAMALRRAMALGLENDSRLLAAIALTQLGLCADGYGTLRRQAIRVLVEELALQVLPDGGHVSRNPARPVDLLLYLLPLRQAFVASGEPLPSTLLTAIDRMMPMIRTFRHGDGALALFNGMGFTRADTLATVLAYDDARGRPLTSAPYSGYQRLEAGDAVLLLDAGPPPPVGFSRRAHAGTLSFEFSCRAQRIIVNCGASASGSPEARAAARTTAAHSTLTVADHSSSRFFATGALAGLLYAGPTAVPVRRTLEPDAVAVEASHDGYEARFGLVHRRRLRLATSGDRLEGDDELTVRAPRQVLGRRTHQGPFDYVVRFHLHPSVRCDSTPDGTASMITLPDGERWEFAAGGLPVRIEESIFFAGADGPRRTDQLVVPGRGQERLTIAWSLVRLPGEPPT